MRLVCQCVQWIGDGGVVQLAAWTGLKTEIRLQTSKCGRRWLWISPFYYVHEPFSRIIYRLKVCTCIVMSVHADRANNFNCIGININIILNWCEPRFPARMTSEFCDGLTMLPTGVMTRALHTLIPLFTCIGRTNSRRSYYTNIFISFSRHRQPWYGEWVLPNTINICDTNATLVFTFQFIYFTNQPDVHRLSLAYVKKARCAFMQMLPMTDGISKSPH